MIIEGVVDLFFSLFESAFSGIQAIGLPYQFLNSITTWLSYGVWICGTDIIGYFVSSITFWWSLKASVGLVVWIWKLLPLT